MKIVDRVYSNLPINAVVRQSPPAGEDMKISQDAHVVLSLGPQNVTIPVLEGESSAWRAFNCCKRACSWVRSLRIPLPRLPLMACCSKAHFRARGTKPSRGFARRASRPPEAAYVMPWLVGMPLPDADRLLSSAGIKLSKTTYTLSPQWPKGDVIAQTPDQGSKIVAETPIELVISQ